jgi:hypothetical protein
LYVHLFRYFAGTTRILRATPIYVLDKGGIEDDDGIRSSGHAPRFAVAGRIFRRR